MEDNDADIGFRLEPTSGTAARRRMAPLQKARAFDQLCI